MLPIRFAPFGLARRLGFWSVFVLFSGVVLDSTEAGPLDQLGIEEFRALIDTKRDFRRFPRREPSAAGTMLAEYRRKIRLEADRLPSLGEVTRVLLLPEWRTATEGFSRGPGAQIRQAVTRDDEQSFKRDVERLMKMAPDEPYSVQEAIIIEIRLDVRSRLVQRLDDRLRYYLRDGRTEDRIAAANMVGDTVDTSRRQESYELMAPAALSNEARSGRFLSRRLSELIGELRNLIEDGNPQVQAAGIRALSTLEIDSAVNLARFMPLLTSPQSDVIVRRAAAAALTQMLEVKAFQMRDDKSRPQPIVRTVQQVLAAAVRGLDDADAEVRRACLAACQRAALVVDDLASDPQVPPARLVAFQPAVDAVDRTLSALNRCARDSTPEMRVLACRTLEAMVLASHKVKHLREQPLPPPLPEPSEPETTPKPSRDRKGTGTRPLPYGRGSVSSRSRSSQWAIARLSEPRPLGNGAANRSLEPQTQWRAGGVNPLIPAQNQGVDTPRSLKDSPAVALERPIKLTAATDDDLPPPAPVDAALQGTLKTMVDNLSDPDYRVRLSALDVLESLGARAEPAMPALIKALSDSNKFIRWASARTLGRLAPRRAEEVVPRLSVLLDDHEDPSVRITAVYALEQYGPAAKGAVPLLARVINRGDKDYIIAVLHAIQGIGTDAAAALPNVAWVMRDRTQPSSVRIEAAQTLGRFGDLAKNQLSSLRDIMVNDPIATVRNAASIAVLAVDRPIKK